MSRVFLRYTFIVDAKGTWDSQDAFSGSLARLFREKGFDTEQVKDSSKTSPDTILLLQKSLKDESTPKAPKGVTAQFKSLKK